MTMLLLHCKLFMGSDSNCLHVNWKTCYVQHVFPFQREGTCDLSLPVGHFGRVVCLFIHEWVCIVCVSSVGPDASTYYICRHIGLVHPANVTIYRLFMSVPDIPEINTIHHSSHQAGSISSLVVTAKAECSPLEPDVAERQSFVKCVFSFYLIVSSFPLSCWNLLWRILICSNETEIKHETMSMIHPQLHNDNHMPFTCLLNLF